MAETNVTSAAITPDQLELVLTTIAEQCDAIRALCDSAIKEGISQPAEHFVVAARQLAKATGMIADRLCRTPMLGGIDEWMLPHSLQELAEHAE